MKKRFVLAAWVAVMGAAAVGAGQTSPSATTSGAATQDGPKVFELKEFNVFEGAEVSPMVMMGERIGCQGKATGTGKYPAMKSSRPLYGSLLVPGEGSKLKGYAQFDFALDAPAEEKGAQTQGAEKAKVPPKYDVLYIDMNGDGDLTNDGVVKVMKDPPANVAMGMGGEGTTVFEYVTLKVKDGAKVREIKVLPRLTLWGDADWTMMSFTSPVARKGMVQLGGKWYEAVLGQGYSVAGRYDLPGTFLQLRKKGFFGTRGVEGEMGTPTLGTLRRVDGKYYQFSATEGGDKLTVDAYRGDMGVVAVGAGKRSIEAKDMGMTGTLQSEKLTVPLGGDMTSGPREHRIPAGDYAVQYLTVRYGSMNLAVSTYSGPEESATRPYPLKVRKDAPVVLDFAATPEVRFAAPLKTAAFSPGDTVEMSAALVDPTLNLMYRGITDPTRKEKQTVTIPGGKTMTVDVPASMVPAVSISDAAGKEVFTGKMPFG